MKQEKRTFILAGGVVILISIFFTYFFQEKSWDRRGGIF
jgi:hypothetical protein